MSSRITKSKTFQGILLLWLGHATVDLYTGVFHVYKTLAGLDLFMSGLIASAGAIGGNLMQLFFGIAGDRGHKKFFMVSGLLLASSTTLLPFFDHSLVLLLIVLATFLGSSSFHPCATGIAGRISEKRTGLAVSAFISGGYLGFGVSHALFSWFYLRFGGNTLPLAVPAVVTAFALWKFRFFATDRQEATDLPVKINFQAFVKVFHSVRVLFFIQVLFTAVHLSVVFTLPELCLAKGSPEWIAFGGGLMFFTFSIALFAAPLGHLSDRIGLKPMLACSSALATILLIAYSTVESPPLPLFLLLLSALGLSLGMINPMVVSLGNRCEKRNSGLVSALLMGVAWSFSSISPTLTGALAEAFSPETALLFFAGVAGLGHLLSWKIRVPN